MIAQHLDAAATQQLEQLVRPYLRFLKAGQPLAGDDKLGDLGLDSMASIDVLLAIEDQFNVQILDDHLAEDTFHSLNTLSELLSRVMNAR